MTPAPMAISVTNVAVRDAKGDERNLSEWAGKVLLIVNVASRCGFTRQYAGLQALQESYRSEERRVGKECRSRWSPYH